MSRLDRLRPPAVLDASDRRSAAVLGVVGLALAWFAAATWLPNGVPLGLVLIGAVLGSATGLAAVGIVLVWRANRIVNFAAGALGGAAGLGSLQLYLSWQWPYVVSALVAVIGGTVLGALVEVLVVRRFANAPRLVLTVATIGLAQLLGGLELAIPAVVFDVQSPVLGAFETPLTSTSFDVGPIVITGDHLLVAAVVPVVVVVLAWFLRRSLAGTAIRAASENVDRGRLLGIPVRNLTTLVWMLAGALAALTFVLRAPFLGATPAAVAGPAVMLPALAAAVVARMQSMPVAFVAAVLLGVVDQVVRWNTTSPELIDVVLFVVIVAALVLRRAGSSRAHDSDGGWRDAELIRRLPPAIAALRPVRLARGAAVAALVAAGVVVPLLVGPGTAYSLSIMAVWALVALSLVVLTGWGGQISLGQFALVGVGAIVAGNLVARWNVDLFVTLAVASAAGALAALLLGLPALRIRGPFLAVVTLAFAVVLDGYVLNPNVLPALIPQEVTRPLLWNRLDLAEDRTMLWFCLAMLTLGIVLAAGVRRSRSGRALIAARDNPKATEAASVSTRWVTLSGFVFSGFLAGLAGGLHVLVLGGARVGSYQPAQSVEVFSMATIGGMGSIAGAISGAAGMRGLQDLDDTIRLVVAGAGVLVVLWLVPAGLAGVAARVRDRLVVPLARRHGLDPEGQPLAPQSDTGTAVGKEPHPAHELVGRPVGPGAPTPPVEAPATSGGPVGPPDSGGPVGPTQAPVPTDVPGSSTASALSARSVSVSYGRLQVLFDVDLEVEQGEIVALLGTNGAGKSTLLRAISGLAPSTGTVRVGGRDLTGRSPEQVVESGVALMPGGRAVFPSLSVDDHLRLATWTFRRDTERIAADLADVHELFPVLAERSDQLAGDLSGGEQQQLALAMTLMLRPEVLLIDELSLGLAPVVVAALCDVVRRLNASGVTVVVVEQSVNVALTLADRAVFLEKGRCRFEGPTRDLLDRPDVLRSVFLEGASGATDDHGRPDEETATPAGGANAAGIDRVDLTRFDRPGDPAGATSREDGAHGPRSSSPPDQHGSLPDQHGSPPDDRSRAPAVVAPDVVAGAARTADPARDARAEPVLVVHGVTKRFGGLAALSDVDLEVAPGEIVGLVGQNGAGKTTLMDCVSGFHDLDGGSVVFRGVDITAWAPFERARGRLGRSFQEARLFPSLTVTETVQVACERSAENRSLVADATRQPASYLSQRLTELRAAELVGLLGLDRYAHTPTSSLSTGTRRIVELACLLAEDPVLMCLDEPSAGVAQRETEALGPLLARIRDHTGAAMLVIEHDMALLASLCDRLVAMELGTVIAEGPPPDVLAHPRVVASYLGTNDAVIARSGTALHPG